MQVERVEREEAPRKRGPDENKIPKALLPIGIAVYGIVEAGRATYRGIKYSIRRVSGELIAMSRTAILESGKLARAINEGSATVASLLNHNIKNYRSETKSICGAGVGQCFELGKNAVPSIYYATEPVRIVGTKVLGEAASQVPTGARQLGLGVKTSAQAAVAAASLPGRPIAQAGGEMLSYVPPGFLEARKAATEALPAAAMIPAYGLLHVYHLVEELISYLPPGAYQIETLVRSSVQLVLDIIGMGTMRRVLMEVVSYGEVAKDEVEHGAEKALDETKIVRDIVYDVLRSAGKEVGSQAVAGGKVIVDGGITFADSTRTAVMIGADASAKTGREFSSQFVAGGSELVKGARELPPFMWKMTYPLRMALSTTVGEALSYLAAGGKESWKGVSMAPNAVWEGTRVPRVLMQAVVIEILAASASGASELWKGARALPGATWEASTIPRQALANAAVETLALLRAGGSEGIKGGRNAVIGMVHALEVPVEVVEQVLAEALGYLGRGGDQARIVGDYLRNDLGPNYEGMVQNPVEIWYYRNKHQIGQAFDELKEAAAERWQEIADWWNGREEAAES